MNATSTAQEERKELSKDFKQQENNYRRLILQENLLAATLNIDSLNSFLELIAQIDVDYLTSSPDYFLPPSTPNSTIDWSETTKLLQDAQTALNQLQELLTITLSSYNISDIDTIRIYENYYGQLSIIGEHSQKDYIELILNNPKHKQLLNLYRLAHQGLAFAGSLVGEISAPEELLKNLHKDSAA